MHVCDLLSASDADRQLSWSIERKDKRIGTEDPKFESKSCCIPPTLTPPVLISFLIQTHFFRICPQQALEKEKELSANKVMHVCDLNQGGADRQLSWLIVLFGQNRCIAIITTMALVDLFSSNAQHTEEHLQSVLR